MGRKELSQTSLASALGLLK